MSGFSTTSLHQNLERMPLLNRQSIELLDMLNLDNLLDHLNEVEGKILRDPALAGSLLRIANSPFFGHGGGITSIRHACVVLGIDAIKTIICTMLVHSDLTPRRSPNDLHYAQIWNHSLLSAFIARELVSSSIHFNAQLTFTTALFNNMHMIIMDVFYPTLFASAIAQAEAQRVDLAEAYKALGVLSPSQLNLEVLTFWRFPAVVLMPFRGIAEAADQQRQEPFMTQLIRFARVMANGLGEPALPRLALLPPQIDPALTLDIDMSRALEACASGHRQFNDYKQFMR